MRKAKRWEVHTNRHVESYSGRSWGWVEGPGETFYWSDDKATNRAWASARADELNAELDLKEAP